MLLKNFVLGLLSASLCLNGLNVSPVPVPSPVPVKDNHTPVKAALTEPAGKEADETLSSSAAAFSDSLLKKSLTYNEGKNLILSPLSVIYALTLCSNGASGETLAEFEALNGISFDLPLPEQTEALISDLRQALLDFGIEDERLSDPLLKAAAEHLLCELSGDGITADDVGRVLSSIGS